MKRHYKRWMAALATATLVAVPGLGHATNGMNDIGVGAKSKGMGGVGIALPQDSYAAAFNPAGMVHVGNRYDIGLGYVFQDAKGSVRSDSVNYPPFTSKSDEGLWFPEIGFNWNFTRCQSLGLTIYTYGALATHYPPPAAETPTYQFQSYMISPSWSWQINRCHSVGVSVNVGWNGLRVSGDIEDRVNQQPNITQLTLYPGYVGNDGNDWELGMGFTVGWLGQITPCFRLGAVFRSTTWMPKYKKYMGINVDAGDYDLPPELGVGFAWDVFPCFTVAFDFVDRLWSSSKTFDHTSRQYNGTIWGQVPGSFGSVNGIGFGWKDQPVWKVGIAYQVLPCLTLRAGYNQADGPIGWSTETQLNILTQAVIEDHVTIGATWYTGCGELSAYYYHGFNYKINGTGSGGVSQDGTGIHPVEFDLNNTQNGIGISYGACF